MDPLEEASCAVVAVTVTDAWMLAGPASVAPGFVAFIAASTFFFARFSLALADLAALSFAAAKAANLLTLPFGLFAGLPVALPSDICDIKLSQNCTVTSASGSRNLTVLVLDSVNADSDLSSA